MLPKYIRDNCKISVSGFCLLMGLALVALPAFSQQASNISQQASSLSPQTILTNIQNTIPNLMRMITAFAFVIGMYMIFSAILDLKHVGEMRTQMSHEHHLAKPMLKMLIGTLLIYLPTSVQVGMSTFWTNPNPYGYVTQLQDQWMQFIYVCFVVIQFIGVLSFIRGLLLLSHVGGGGHQGALGKGLTHVVGGIFCINIYQFLQVIFATLGINS